MLQGAFLMHAAREFDNYTEDMIEASDFWASVEAPDGYINLPPYITLPTVDSQVVTPVKTDINTSVDECLIKFIIGDLDFDQDYDAFVDTLHQMNLELVLDAYQKAYDSFMALQET